MSKIKKKIIKCYLIGKNVNFFKKQLKNNLDYIITKNLKNSIIQIFKDIRIKKNVNKNILLSPAAASFDQYTNFEKRGNEFKKLCLNYARKLI